MEKYLIERLMGRNLSELLHALRQEQRKQGVRVALWEGRSNLKWAGIRERDAHQTYSDTMLEDILDVLFS